MSTMDAMKIEPDPDGCTQQVAVIMTGKVYRDAGLKHSKHPKVEGLLYDRLCLIGKHKLRDDVRRMALSIAISVRDKEFKPTVAWLDNFMRRFCLSKKKMGFHSAAMLKVKAPAKSNEVPATNDKGLTQEEVFSALGFPKDFTGMSENLEPGLENGSSSTTEEATNGKETAAENGVSGRDGMKGENGTESLILSSDDDVGETKAQNNSAAVNAGDSGGGESVSTSNSKVDIVKEVDPLAIEGQDEDPLTTEMEVDNTPATSAEMEVDSNVNTKEKEENTDTKTAESEGKDKKESENNNKEQSKGDTEESKGDKENKGSGKKVTTAKGSDGEDEVVELDGEKGTSNDEAENQDSSNESGSQENGNGSNSEGDESGDDDGRDDDSRKDKRKPTEGEEGEKKSKQDEDEESIEYSKEESKYYKKNIENLQKRLAASGVRCMSCFEQVNHQIRSLVHTHPILGIFICKRCRKYYGKGKFCKDDDGYDEYCRLCAEGGDLLCCEQTECFNGFCKRCIKRTMGRTELRNAEKAKKWACYVCDPTAMMELRALHRAILNNLKEEEEKKSNLSRKELRDTEIKSKFALLKRKRLESAKKTAQENAKKIAKKKTLAKPEPWLRNIMDNFSKMLFECLNNVNKIEDVWALKYDYSKEGTEKTGKRICRQLIAMKTNFEFMENDISNELAKLSNDTSANEKRDNADDSKETNKKDLDVKNSANGCENDSDKENGTLKNGKGDKSEDKSKESIAKKKSKCTKGIGH